MYMLKNSGETLSKRVVAEVKGQHLNRYIKKEVMVDSMKYSHCQSEDRFFL